MDEEERKPNSLEKEKQTLLDTIAIKDPTSEEYQIIMDRIADIIDMQANEKAANGDEKSRKFDKRLGIAGLIVNGVVGLVGATLPTIGRLATVQYLGKDIQDGEHIVSPFEMVNIQSLWKHD